MMARKWPRGLMLCFLAAFDSSTFLSAFCIGHPMSPKITVHPSLKHCPYTSSTKRLAKPKRGSVVDSYQTVSVNCAKCGERLFRYKKKNGTKSNLIKCFVERIAEDSAQILQNRSENDKESNYACPSCQTVFARPATIRGLAALKLVGGKVRMTKK